MEQAAVRAGCSVAPLDRIALWALAGGVVGARLFFVLDHASTYAAAPLAALAIWRGGIAVYGGFVGGIAGGLIAARRTQVRVWPLLDAAAPAMLIGQAIGRLGCLSNGDAWGAPCTGRFGVCVVYSDPHDLLPADLLGAPTHAYPLYEVVAVGLLLLSLWRARRLRSAAAPGTTFLTAAFGYAVLRFGLTAFRQETIVLWGLQEAQLVALATGVLALALLVVRNGHHDQRAPGGSWHRLGTEPQGTHP
jgi:phosphatidylglycerol:prolipoprotein diacylglycerol transferase